ncbi:hypothetical protein G7068_06835 [Leucobacter viscericola]|uniref:Uncharacterized protein n=1 Tax=Leucobacter viscericola TaxID=2714935 RepID=A0A6G7XEG9_9MICO|nr:hypothetical protein [Leucobacter viscericola]QIK62943.1 hypothetical protein G7068_06835 [Leucobacter viscericola]
MEPLVDASVVALRAATEQHPGAKVLSVDFFWGALASIEEPAPGRAILFSYPDGAGRELLAKKWVFATGRHHLHVVATYLPSQAADLEETFDWIARSLRLRDETGKALEAAAMEGHALLNEKATVRAGFPIEQLDRLQELRAHTEREFPREELATVAAVRGLTGFEDRLLGIHVRCGAVTGSYNALSTEPGVAVVRSGGTSAFDVVGDTCDLYGLSGEQLLADVFAWTGITPGFVFDGGQTFELSEYERNVRGINDQVSEGACWTECQFEFSLQHQWVIVLVPSQGWFEVVMPSSEVVSLHPLPSARFVSVIQQRLSEAFVSSDKSNDKFA